MTAYTAPFFLQQFTDQSGKPLSGGSLTFLVAGSTSLPKDIYVDYAMTLHASNPLPLDSVGRAPNYFMESGLYKIVVKDAQGGIVDTSDNIAGVADPSIAIDDHKVKVTNTDIAPNFLSNKMFNTNTTAIRVADSGIGGDVIGVDVRFSGIPNAEVIGTDGSGNPIAVSPNTLLNYKVKVDSSDNVPDYLENKLQPYVGIAIDAAGGLGGFRFLNFSSLGYVVVGSGDTVNQGPLDDKLIAGSGITSTIANNGAFGKQMTLSVPNIGKIKSTSSDTSFDYLDAKLIAGAGITLTSATDSEGTKLVINAKGNSWRLIKYITANYTVLDTDDTIVIRANANVTLPTPSASYEGRIVTVRNAGSYSCTVLGAVVGGTTLGVYGKYEYMCFNNGSGYFWFQQ